MKTRLVFSVAIFTLGCAYNFSGFTTRSVKSIAVPVFENKTNRYGIEESITKSVTDAFIKDNRLKVVDRKKAGSILLGEITQYSREPFSYDDQRNVKDYKIDMGLNLTYLSITVKDSSKTDTLLTKQISDWFAYSADSTEESGIERLCVKIAEDIVKLILE